MDVCVVCVYSVFVFFVGRVIGHFGPSVSPGTLRQPANCPPPLFTAFRMVEVS
jgi:hypothetical protein